MKNKDHSFKLIIQGYVIKNIVVYFFIFKQRILFHREIIYISDQ